jgi:hypothetical protein
MTLPPRRAEICASVIPCLEWPDSDGGWRGAGREGGPLLPERAFDVKYDGPALTDSRMPVRDLAPALLALGDLFTQASKVTYPDKPPVSLEIRATSDGSFIANLILSGLDGPWDQMVDMFTSKDADALGNLIGIVIGGGIGTGLLRLIQLMQGRAVVAQEPADQSGMVKLTLDDDTSVEVPSEVATLSGNVSVRKSARAVVQPLSRDGVEALEFREESEVVLSLGQADVPSFAVPSAEVEDPDAPQEQVFESIFLEIVQPTITGDDYKWRLTMGEGSSTFRATIQDEDYLRRVRSHEQRFAAGDRLRCSLRIVQHVDGDKIKNEHFVTTVHEHIETMPQAQFEDTGEAA